MKYDVKLLSQKYAEELATKKFFVKKPKISSFNISAYNDYEYIKLILELTNMFNNFNDLTLTEEFLKGE